MKSTAQKLTQLEGMLDTTDLTEWQNRFVRSILRQREDQSREEGWDLSDKQLEIIDEIYERHFA